MFLRAFITMLALESSGFSKGRVNESGRGVHLLPHDEHGDERIAGPRAGVARTSSYRIRSKHEKEDASVQQLRSTLSNSLVNTGILSVFLCALADAVYVSPSLNPTCKGAKGVQMVFVIEWCSMACFFLVIVVTVILSTDMEGVPDDLLVAHLKDNILLYSFHYPLAHVGIMLLAVGYGMDLDERVGCLLIPFGAIAAPCFPVITFAIMRYAQIRRRRSGGGGVGTRR